MVTRAQGEGQPRIEGQARRQLASAHVFTEQFPRAVEELIRARDLFARAGDRQSEARCLLEIAQILRRQGQLPEAMRLARSAASSFRDLQDRDGILDAAELIVYVMPDDEDHTPVRNESLAIVDAEGRTLACGVLHEWADELFGQGRGAEAFTRVTQARDCFHRTGARDREARALVSLGRVYRLHDGSTTPRPVPQRIRAPRPTGLHRSVPVPSRP